MLKENAAPPFEGPCLLDSDQDERSARMLRWISEHSIPGKFELNSVRLIAQDASFRRYFRINTSHLSLNSTDPSMVIMDAPPPFEPCENFLHAAAIFRTAGICVPEIRAASLEQGFLLLEDLGETTFFQKVNTIRSTSTHPDRESLVLYRKALDALALLQEASRPDVFPEYSQTLLENEIRLFSQWYLTRYRQQSLSPRELLQIESVFSTIVAQCLTQTRVFVHRDFHSRNLMFLGVDKPPGVLDFQDAVLGPVTYDLVSLLRDAYLDWPPEIEQELLDYFWCKGREKGLTLPDDPAHFYRDFEWMGLQRHLKILGVFARLRYRDNKPDYLRYIPRLVEKTRSVCEKYVSLQPLLNHLGAAPEIRAA